MSRVSDIISAARYSLADPDGDRWSDSRLLQLINDAQKTIAKRGRLLRNSITFDIELGKSEVNLPNDFQALDTALYADKLLNLIDTFTLDNNASKWYDKVGTPRYVVTDMNNKGVIKLYPKPDISDNLLITFIHANGKDYSYSNIIEDIKVIDKLLSSEGLNNLGFYGFIDYDSLPNYGVPLLAGSDFGIPIFWFPVDFGVVTWGEDFGVSNIGEDFGFINTGNIQAYIDIVNNVNLNTGSFGVITDIDDKISSNQYGVITDIELDGKYYGDKYGSLTKVATVDTNFKLRYIRKPKPITDVNDELEINDSLDLAIRYYVLGYCLRDDNDAQNRTVGNEYLQLFENELREAIIESSKDFIDTSRYFNTKYFNGFN
ncbi:hypothetical protein I0O82_001223 [Campylobacter jejuni]|nr:hypothetical protein [Campylobacter jejuni]